MSGRDLLTDERRLFEDLCAREYLAAGFQGSAHETENIVR